MYPDIIHNYVCECSCVNVTRGWKGRMPVLTLYFAAGCTCVYCVMVACVTCLHVH